MNSQQLMAQSEGNVNTCWTMTKVRPRTCLRCHVYEWQRGWAIEHEWPFFNLFSVNALLLRLSELRWSHSILHPNECDCDLLASDYEALRPLSRWLPGQGLGFFQRLEYCTRRWKIGFLWCEGSQQHTLPAQKGLIHMSKLISILDILFQTRV